MQNYLILKKKCIINFREFFENRVFFWQHDNFKILFPIYRNSEIICNTHLFPLHNEPSPMPVG